MFKSLKFLKIAVRDKNFPFLTPLYFILRRPFELYINNKIRKPYDEFAEKELSEIENIVNFSIWYFLKGVEGDIAEFGFQDGQYAKIECKYLSLYNANRNIHLFDSFSGYPDLTEKDKHLSQKQFPNIVQKNQKNISQIKNELGKLYYPERIIIHEGFFEDTLPCLQSDIKFGVIVMDCDLYSSSFTVFNNLFYKRKVTEGAVILFNRWFAHGARQDISVQGAWHKAAEEYKINYSVAGHYGWSGLKIIVHSYK